MKTTNVRLLNVKLLLSVFQIIGLNTADMSRNNTTDMANMHTQRDVGNTSCYTPIEICMTTGGNGSMERTTVCILNSILS